MFLRIGALLLLLIPFVSNSQYDKSWKLYVNQKEIGSVAEDSVLRIQLDHKDSTDTLKFIFASADPSLVKKLIVLNEQRNNYYDVIIDKQERAATFNLEALYRQVKGENIDFYIVNTPADPAKAALVRVAPRLICKLKWKD